MTQGPVTLTITVTNKTHLGQTSLAYNFKYFSKSDDHQVGVRFVNHNSMTTDRTG